VSNIEDFSAPQPEEASQDNRHQFEGVFDGMREAAKRTRNGGRIISFSCLAFGSALWTGLISTAPESRIFQLNSLCSEER